MPSPIAPTDAVDRIRLARTHRIGPIAYAQLIARFGSATAALAALPDLARQSGGKVPQSPRADVIAAEIDQVTSLGGYYLFIDQQGFPPLLREAHGVPPILIAAGRADLLARPAIAMVGARNASAAACRFARMLAAELGEAGGHRGQRPGPGHRHGSASGCDRDRHSGGDRQRPRHSLSA